MSDNNIIDTLKLSNILTNNTLQHDYKLWLIRLYIHLSLSISFCKLHTHTRTFTSSVCLLGVAIGYSFRLACRRCLTVMHRPRVDKNSDKDDRCKFYYLVLAHYDTCITSVTLPTLRNDKYFITSRTIMRSLCCSAVKSSYVCGK